MRRKITSGRRVALAWYEPEEWVKLRAVAVDVDDLAATYEKWLADAHMALRAAADAGVEIVKVEIAVDELVAWCKAKGLAVNGRARARYAAKKGRTGS